MDFVYLEAGISFKFCIFYILALDNWNHPHPMMIHRPRATEFRSDSGEVELGVSECSVNTNIKLTTVGGNNGNGILKIEFTLCNKIITNPPPLPRMEENNSASTIIQEEFQRFCFQTVRDFKSMLNDINTADVTIKVTLGEEKTFHCHKVILIGLLLRLFEISLQVEAASVSF